jgi:hypothetical protein
MKYWQPLRPLAIFLILCSCEGEMGPDGKNSLVNLVDESAGSNCAYGGIKIESGIDTDANTQLDPGEVVQTRYVCKGNPGIQGNPGSNSLTAVTNESAGSNCPAGGFKIQAGVDANGNSTLETSEIKSTRYLCNLENDKQLRLELGAPNVMTASQEWVQIPFETWMLVKFNKLNYSDVDSITFVPSIGMVNYNSVEPPATAHVELFNVTDDEPIAGSELQSDVYGYLFKESGDIYDALPNKEITLSIRVKSSNPLVMGGTGYVSYLFIYRH